jgi:hypothetical protein
MKNGIMEIEPLKFDGLKRQDLVSLLFTIAGAKCSDMPADYQSKSYSNKWELFDPEKVDNPKDLPDYWKMVYDMHNRLDMKDCKDLRYRYVHTPEKILPRYPRVPCQGIFQLDRDTIDIRETSLIHIGNEFEEI